MTVSRTPRLEFVSGEWARFEDVLDVLYDVLYRDFGVARGTGWYDARPDSVHSVALGAADEILGTARLMPAPGDTARQIRQVAVVESAQGLGVGRALVHALESHAAAEGATRIWLHARDTAFPFYERLGYRYTSELFVSELTGIPHRTMEREL